MKEWWTVKRFSHRDMLILGIGVGMLQAVFEIGKLAYR